MGTSSVEFQPSGPMPWATRFTVTVPAGIEAVDGERLAEPYRFAFSTLEPSLITSDPSLQTLPVVQSIFQSQFSANYNIAFASYLMAMAPTVVAYLFAQRWVMTGVTRGAIK